MYETGAGGSAPKHVKQLVEENHLRWDSLGEFLALAVSLEDLASRPAMRVPRSWRRRWMPLPASCWRTTRIRRPRQDNWTTAAASSTSPCTGPRELAAQTDDAGLAAQFAPLARRLAGNEQTIVAELLEVQGQGG